jgi:hypothetical protein
MVSYLPRRSRYQRPYYGEVNLFVRRMNRKQLREGKFIWYFICVLLGLTWHGTAMVRKLSHHNHYSNSRAVPEVCHSPFLESAIFVADSQFEVGRNEQFGYHPDECGRMDHGNDCWTHLHQDMR